jgi:hypothetical protein
VSNVQLASGVLESKEKKTLGLSQGEKCPAGFRSACGKGGEGGGQCFASHTGRTGRTQDAALHKRRRKLEEWQGGGLVSRYVEGVVRVHYKEEGGGLAGFSQFLDSTRMISTSSAATCFHKNYAGGSTCSATATVLQQLCYAPTRHCY